MTKSEPVKTFERTSDGLRDLIMSEIEDVRAGIATPDEARAIAELAFRAIQSLEADLAKERLEDDKERTQYDRRMAVEKRARIAAKKAQLLIEGTSHECAA